MSVGRSKALRRWLPGLVVLAGVVIAVGGLGEERRFAELVHRAHPAWLLVVAALQVATYATLAWIWRRAAARYGARPPSLGSLIDLALAELFVDQAVPSGGLSGTVLVVRVLERRGLAPRAAAAAVTVSLVGFYGAQAVAVPSAFLVLALHRDVNRHVVVVAAVATAVALLTPTLAYLLSHQARGRLPRAVMRLGIVARARSVIDRAPRDLRRRPALVGEAIGARLAIMLLDGTSLAAALASTGQTVELDLVVAVFVLASAVASVSFLPGGLGGFEAASIALLALLGIPVEAAAAGTLLLRGFSFWLPMVPGAWLARRASRQEG